MYIGAWLVVTGESALFHAPLLIAYAAFLCLTVYLFAFSTRSPRSIASSARRTTNTAAPSRAGFRDSESDATVCREWPNSGLLGLMRFRSFEALLFAVEEFI